jgi:hypothetical protein
MLWIINADMLLEQRHGYCELNFIMFGVYQRVRFSLTLLYLNILGSGLSV